MYQSEPNENHGALIAHVKFSGENFDEWAQAIWYALRAKKRFIYVNGSVLKPKEDNLKYEHWVSVDSMVVLWILNISGSKVRRTLANKEDPVVLWTKIKERFSEGNGPRNQEIKAELVNCQKEGMSISDYYGRLQMLWEDLINYDQTPVCKCGRCTCNIGAKLEKKKEDDKIHQFLLSLDEAVFGGVRTSIVTLDPLYLLEFASHLYDTLPSSNT